jgi:FixJ family two-component response regulator
MSDESTDQLNVLLVDDEPLTLDLMVDIVTRQGHQAVPAESAEDILKLLPFWTFQVALIDHHLPGMEGMVLGEYLRRNNPDMTIAIVTGAPDADLVRRSDELGLDFIAKPFEIKDIIQVFERYKQAAEEREQYRFERKDDDYLPPLSRFSDLLTATYEIPNVPARIETRLTDTIKRSLNNLRSIHRYNEKDRVIAYTGLISARVLGVRLPKTSADRSLYEEYDALMSERGRRREFS